MFSRLKAYFKSKDYKINESYFSDGFEVKIQEDEEGQRIISLRTSVPNRLIKVSKGESKIKHVINDSSNGTMEIEIPIHVYEKLFAAENVASNDDTTDSNM
ncbi:hypothetical protein [Bacillus sp. FSL K6-3431]|uniref:hypothetical protein n=1 Tax=Bacillus sp. FSL K6-3431 TaxID=2921500 RepID=UPI0030F90763